jgi:hypothetical protein
VEGLGAGGMVAPAFGDVQVADVFDGRDDGGADSGQVDRPAAGAAGGRILTETHVADVLWGSKRHKQGVLTDHPGRVMINYSPSSSAVLHMWQVRTCLAPDQQR